MFHGVATALVTPFKNNQIDEQAFEELVLRQLKAGIHGLVVCGSTGEASSLSKKERAWLIQKTVELVNKRVPVIAGTGALSTIESLELSKQAEECGADGIMVVAPPYVKPTQDGLYAHFKEIHDSVNIPLILYNNPGRAVVDISIETICKLSGLKNIVGLKDATGDLSLPTKILKQSSKFSLYSGEDSTAVAFLAEGGHGTISVTANVVPELCVQLHEAWFKKDLEAVEKLRFLLCDLHQAMFVKSNPLPVKKALSLLNLCQDTCRLPLQMPKNDAEFLSKIQKAMNELGLFSNSQLENMGLKQCA